MTVIVAHLSYWRTFWLVKSDIVIEIFIDGFASDDYMFQANDQCSGQISFARCLYFILMLAHMLCALAAPSVWSVWTLLFFLFDYRPIVFRILCVSVCLLT